MRMRRRLSALALVIAGFGIASTASADEQAETTKTDMSKGGVAWSWGDNSIRLYGFAQFRLFVEDQEEFDSDPPGSTGFGVADGTNEAFQIPRIRLGFRGSLWRPWLKYAISYELSQTTGDRDTKFKDAYVEFAAVPLGTVRFGQFMVQFGFQELLPDEAQLFAERAITNAFAPGREQGAALMGSTKGKHFGYAVGAFNGSGESKNQDDAGLMYATQVYWDPLGEYKMTESSLDVTDRNMLHLALGYRTGEPGRGYNTQGVFQDPNNQDALNVAVGWKAPRYTVEAEYYTQTTEVKNPPPAAPDVDSDGWHVQASVTAIPQKLEFGARYAEVDGDTNSPTGKATETRGLVSYYWKGHNLKLLFDFGTLGYQAGAPGRNVNGSTLATGTRLVPGDVTDKVGRLQVQLAF
jgi:hypothetical protein